MTITINGEQHPLPQAQTIDQLLASKGFGENIAVALNGAFIPRTTYGKQVIKDGDSIEIVSPMQGG